MNIKILDSWLREYVHTKATPQKISELLSLTSVAVERLEKHGNDYVYDIEITTNRVDLMSIIGLARETAAVMQQNGIEATFHPLKPTPKKAHTDAVTLTIKNDPKLIHRICAVIMEVKVKPSPKEITERLEATDIRSLNNLIDITNYVMRVTGHPTHVFDFDRLDTKSLTIREAKAGEKIITLDDKNYTLKGGDIVAVDDAGRIVDLIGIMGLKNSVVTNDTKRVLFFIDSNDSHHMRKTSMSLGIRTEAVVLNEKDVDPEMAMEALQYGIELFQKNADAHIVSDIIDMYPVKPERKKVSVTEEQINTVMGVEVSLKQAAEILKSIDFETNIKGNTLTATPPSARAKDITIPEDIIEEIARIYGYHNIPSKIPPFEHALPYVQEHNQFFWEDRVKDMFKYWGFTEVYTYPMIPENMAEESVLDMVTIANPLSEEFVYMRKSLTPSLLRVLSVNKRYDQVSIFELANVYHKKSGDLPEQLLMLAGVTKKPKASFFEMKGVIEQMCTDLGIEKLTFVPTQNGAAFYHPGGGRLQRNEGHDSPGVEQIGEIQIVEEQTISFELHFEELIKNAKLKKIYKPASKYPPVVEDLALIAPDNVTAGELMALIKKQSALITDVSLLDKYQETRTFHIVYQSYAKNLTMEEVGDIRKKILKALDDKFSAKLKE